MLYRLAQLDVKLLSDSPQIGDYWRRLFAGPSAISASAADGEPLSLSLQLVEGLAVPSSSDRVYRDAQGILDVYARPKSGFALHFRHGALVIIDPDRDTTARGAVTGKTFNFDRLEDVTYVSLAALLRRRSRYLVHAAAMSNGEGAILFVGPSQSGKTTTGLALLLSGWKFLASDVVILSRSHGAITAYPTPGFVNVRPPTFELLPQLRELTARKRNSRAAARGRLQLKAAQWSEPAPVSAICFPQVTSASQSRLEPLDASVGLAQLMEESVDRWDTKALLQHMEFLTALSRQASYYRLHLGADVNALSRRLQKAL